MNSFGTITEICRITIFIRGIIADGYAFDSDRQGFQERLDHELLFMESFRSLFFNNDGSFMRHDRLPANLKRDVEVTLAALRKTLAEYGMLAAKHGLLDLESDGQTAANDEASASSGERIKFKAIDLKKSVNWALFGKKQMLKTLWEYSEWSERLRQTMSLMLLTMTAFGDTTLHDFADSKRAKDMGLQEVAQRQILAQSGPPESFKALDGRIVEGSESADSSVRLAKYEDEWGAVKEVVVEYRAYSDALAHATEVNSPDISKLKIPIKNLAWLLCSASFADRSVDATAASDRPSISTLQCLGYLDQPEHYRTIFLYQLPQLVSLGISLSITTLHGLINSAAVGAQASRTISKPPLGNRFSLAHTLALTVLNIHSSGWVHKNISSRGIVVFPSSAPLSGSRSQQHLIPYLTSWGLARPVLGNTDLATNTEVEPNFYRHPSRQGQPKSQFTAEHDIYALGVVLLEIALWRTISGVFKKQIDKATVEGRLPPPEMVRRALLERTRADVPREMGEAYTRAVERCLKGDFGVGEGGDERTALLIAAREMVVEVIAGGVKL